MGKVFLQLATAAHPHLFITSQAPFPAKFSVVIPARAVPVSEKRAAFFGTLFGHAPLGQAGPCRSRESLYEARQEYGRQFPAAEPCFCRGDSFVVTHTNEGHAMPPEVT
jgi:hypothetical protein